MPVEDPQLSFDLTPFVPECLSCRVELSSTLDAYYGKDPYLAELCCKCRSKSCKSGQSGKS